MQQTLKDHSDIVSAVVFSFDSKLVASGSYNKIVKLWDLATSTLWQTFKGYSLWVSAVVFFSNGKLVVLVSGCQWTAKL